jgi:hypothetical protein
MDPATRRRLEEYFEPHNRRLYEYLGVDFGWLLEHTAFEHRAGQNSSTRRTIQFIATFISATEA